MTQMIIVILQIVGRFENEGHNVTVTRFTTEQIVTIPVVFIAMEVTTPSLTTLSPSVSIRGEMLLTISYCCCSCSRLSIVV